MSDLINRKEAVEAVKNEMLSWLEGDSHDYRKVVDAIMDLPTVDAIPIKWLKEQAENPSNSDKLRNAIDYVVYYLVYTRWQGRKEE